MNYFYLWRRMTPKERDGLIIRVLNIPADWDEELKAFIKPCAVFDENNDLVEMRTVFSPSENIYDIWEIVDRMARSNWNLNLLYLDREKEWNWLAKFSNDSYVYRGYGRTVPEAICVSALRVFGKDIDLITD